MRERIIKNTTVPPEEYDRISQYINTPENTEVVSSEYKKQLLIGLIYN